MVSKRPSTTTPASTLERNGSLEWNMEVPGFESVTGLSHLVPVALVQLRRTNVKIFQILKMVETDKEWRWSVMEWRWEWKWSCMVPYWYLRTGLDTDTDTTAIRTSK